jgi:penicillin-binding protein 2
MRSPSDVIIIQNRARWMLLFIIGAFLLCVGTYWLEQIVRGPYYSRLAQNNQFRERSIAAPRGKILDRTAEVVLVDSRPAFNLYIVPEQCSNVDEAISTLRGMIELSDRELQKIEQRRRRLPAFQPLLIKEDIPFELMAYIEARNSSFPWALIAVDHRRSYPKEQTAAHLLGHVGEITEAQLASDLFAGAKPGSMVGQAGLELRYQRYLSGSDGQVVQVVDSLGRVIREVSRHRPEPGEDLILTIDYELQRRAEELYADKHGALVCIDVRNGDILAMVSSPAFDPNSYIELFPRLVSDSASPLLNRAVSSKFSPGSVWKVLIAAAALQEGIITPDRLEFCAGAVNLAGRFVHCSASGGHGWVNVVQALTVSCNIFFYKTGHRLGIERIDKWATRFGFGEQTGIDLPFEVPGLVPTPEWKLKVHGEVWYPSETVSVSIGQGPLEVTPLQLAVFMAAVANGGKLMTPHLVRGVRDLDGKITYFPPPAPRSVGIDEENLRVVREGLYGVVNRGGTAARARIPQISIAGKTGTAQVIRKRFGLKPEDLPEELRHHAWFVCFAPYEKPEIAVCVFVEHGGSSHLSSVPLAAEFLRSYAERRGQLKGDLGVRISE